MCISVVTPGMLEAAGRSAMDTRLLGQIPIQDEGRIKPLDTYARTVLLQFSGKRTFDKRSAVDWLAKVLFTPQETVNDKVFLINSPEIPAALGISVETHRRYSYGELEEKLDKLRSLAIAADGIEQKDRSLVEQEILRVYSNLVIYIRLRGAFAAPRAEWSGQVMDTGFNIIPSDNPNDEMWYSPAVLIKKNSSDSQMTQELRYLQAIAAAYIDANQIEFDLNIKKLIKSTTARVSAKQDEVLRRLPLELFYNKARLFSISWIFYLCAFFAFIFFLVWPRTFRREVGLGLLLLGFVPHATALILRILIMQRPPVTNLYETFIFVGVIIVLAGILIESINKKWLGIVTASIGGFVFLAIADKFSAEGDTLKMLVAVLDSNFWLATHVLSITIGYAGACAAGIIGHLYIIQALLSKTNQKTLSNTYSYLLGALGFGLTMTFLGTMLGGVWADQSWGRFWGWDPKENGALLIVIWIAIIFHAKTGKIINPLGVAVGACLGTIVVMWAWFGVNLLSIGLHSYGFTSGVATNLAIYVAIEILFICVSVLILGKRGISV